MNKPSDSTSSGLIDRARRGDPQAWREMVDRYVPLVRYWVVRGNVSRQDQDDLIQEILLGVFRRLKDYRHESFRGFLRIVARNKTADHFRRTGRQPPTLDGSSIMEMLLNSLPLPTETQSGDRMRGDGPTKTGESSPGDGQTFAFDEMQLEDAQLVARAVADIQKSTTPRNWEIFHAVVIDGRDRGEVAQQHGVTLGALYQAVSSIKRRLLKRMRELGVEPPE
ncbi:MAG: sigma-70 family RNA polymerase sigma factor [Pirellulaceae bacterium]